MTNLPPVSVQLWSARDEVGRDLPGTLQRLAAAGFRCVEPFDIVSDPVGLGVALADAGLLAPSTHAGITAADDLDRVFTAAATLNIGIVVQSMIGLERWQQPGGIEQIADELAAAGACAAAYGLRVGYHNHAFELEHHRDGVPYLEVLHRLLDPAVLLELDTYWAAVGGQDVPGLIGRLGDRVRLLHLKDGPIAPDTSLQEPVGQGAMPIWPIIQAATALEVPVLEFDGYRGDVVDGLAAGLWYLGQGPSA